MIRRNVDKQFEGLHSKMASRISTLLTSALIFQVLQAGSDGKAFLLKPGQVETLVIPTRGIHSFSVSSSVNKTFMLQLHSQRNNMTLCSSPEISYSSCKQGLDIGMYAVTPAKKEKSSILWYVRVNSTHNETFVAAYLHLFGDGDPLPGGCNEVFNLENDPNIQLTYQAHHTRMFFQWANWFSKPSPNCDAIAVQSDLVYDVYIYYLDARSLGLESYLDSVSKMMLMEDIEDNGRKVFTLENTATSKPQFSVASELSRGVVHSVIVRSKRTGHSAPYVTAVTYCCNFDKGECSTDLSPGSIIIVILCFLSGLYMLLLGHRMFHLSQFAFGYIATFILAFLLLHMAYSVPKSVIFGIAGCMGAIGGVLCLLFWHYCFFPIASVLVPGVCAGYLVAATVFFTPFGNLEWWESNENYILAFICVILLFAVALMAFSKFLSILSSSLIGAYFVLMVIAVPLRSSLRLVYLYTEYRQTEPGFEEAKMVPPMLTIDITLLTLWCVVMIMGMVFQYYRERGRPHFERFDLKRTIRALSPRPEEGQAYDTDSEASEADSNEDGEGRQLLPGPGHVVQSSQQRSPPIPSYQSIYEPRDSPLQNEKGKKKR